MRIANKPLAALALTLASSAYSAGAGDPAFPASFDLSRVVISLERGQCHHGSCPEYTVEISGGGSVVYEGKASVLIEGKLGWTIPQPEVAALIDELRQADYLQLKDEYSDGWYGGAHQKILLTIAGRTKSISDNGGSICKPGAPTDGCLPERVREMQDAIDRVSGSISLTQGDHQTIPRLEQAGFDFHAATAASALLFALDKMNTGLAREFISRGAPMSGGHLAPSVGEKVTPPAILLVPATGDVQLAQSMIAKGALAGTDTRQFFLLTSAASGSAAMTRLALEHYPDLRTKPAEFPWVVAAATAEMNTDGTYWRELYAKPEYALWVRNFDPPAVLRLLIAAGADPKAVGDAGNTALHLVDGGAAAQVLLDAGADPNAVNGKGQTPLHAAQSEDLARALIRAGARVMALDAEGATPLFDRYDAKTVRVLLQAGADVKYRAPNGTTALFFQSNAETTVALTEAGADVNARMRGGLSVLESAKSIESALVILRAGAVMPDDPARLEKLLGWAADNKSEALLRELRSRAAEKGS